MRAYIILQCSEHLSLFHVVVLCISNVTCFPKTLSRYGEPILPRIGSPSPSLSFIQFRWWVSTMSPREHTGLFTRIFGKSVKRCVVEIYGCLRNPHPHSISLTILLFLSLSYVRQRLLYNPRVIHFPSR